LIDRLAPPPPPPPPPPPSFERPIWRHPAVTIAGAVAGIFLVTLVFVQLGEGTEPDDVTAPLATPTVPRDTPAPLPTPVPLPPSVFVDPGSTDGRDREGFEAALDSFLRAVVESDSQSTSDATWSRCDVAPAALTDSASARIFADSPTPAYEMTDVVVLNDDIATATVITPSVPDGETLLFVWEGEWRSGYCPDAADDLGTLVELPENIIGVAGLDFSDRVLDGQQFYQADLRGASFAGTSLVDGVFSGALIDGATFSDADLQRAFFGRAIAGPTGADFTGATLDEAFFFEADLRSSVFDGISAVGADFGFANLAGATFVDANLSGAFFDGVDASRVSDWSGATCPDGELADDHDATCVGHLDPFG